MFLCIRKRKENFEQRTLHGELRTNNNIKKYICGDIKVFRP